MLLPRVMVHLSHSRIPIFVLAFFHRGILSFINRYCMFERSQYLLYKQIKTRTGSDEC